MSRNSINASKTKKKIGGAPIASAPILRSSTKRIFRPRRVFNHGGAPPFLGKRRNFPSHLLRQLRKLIPPGVSPL